MSTRCFTRNIRTKTTEVRGYGIGSYLLPIVLFIISSVNTTDITSLKDGTLVTGKKPVLAKVAQWTVLVTLEEPMPSAMVRKEVEQLQHSLQDATDQR
jgi:hypothetical protein